MMRSIFMLIYCLFWVWAVLGLFFKGEYVSSLFTLFLGIILYFVIFFAIWKRKRGITPKNGYESSSNSSWNLFISDSPSDSASSDSSGGGDGGGGGGD